MQRNKLLFQILTALILGSITGIVLPQNFVLYGDTTLINIISPFGDLFVRLLKMIMMPVIICSLIVGTSSISPSHLKKVGGKMILFYGITTFFAIFSGLVVASIFQPGVGLNLTENSPVLEKKPLTENYSQILLNIIPTNPIEAMVKGDVLAVVAFCLFIGISLAFCKDSSDKRIHHSAQSIYNFFDGFSEVMFKIIHWIMLYAPIGVFALMFVVFNKNGTVAFSSLLNLTATYFSSLFLMLILYALIFMFIKINPVKFYKKASHTMLTAFVTRSSNGTLPLTMQTAEIEMGIPKSIYGFILPVGTTVNMNGTTAYLGVCTIFIANACGITLTADEYVMIVLSMIFAFGVAGIPGAGPLILLLVLESIGIDVTGNVAIVYGMILGIDSILDMGRTAVNVTGDIAGSVYVAKTENKIDITKWE